MGFMDCRRRACLKNGGAQNQNGPGLRKMRGEERGARLRGKELPEGTWAGSKSNVDAGREMGS